MTAHKTDRPSVRRLVTLAPQDYQTVKREARERGLGGKGFSAALRLIIREWQHLRQQFELALKPDASPPDHQGD